MKAKSYQDVINFYKPIESFLCLLYPTIESTINDGEGYAGDSKLPAKIIISTYDVYATMHEFAHIIEWSMSKNKRRLIRYGFGFHYSIDGWGYDCPRTCKGFEREIRTIAIQFFILNHFKKQLNLTSTHIIHEIKSGVDAICTFLSDAFIFEHDAKKMGIDINTIEYSKRNRIFKKQVFRRVLLEMGNLSIEDITKHRNQCSKYFKKKELEHKLGDYSEQ